MPVEKPVKVRPARFDEKYPRDKWPDYEKPASLIRTDMHCCGVKEIHGIQNAHTIYNEVLGAYIHEIQTPEELIPQIQARYAECGVTRPRPFLIFTDNTGKAQAHGEPLAKYIEANKLGTVHRSSLQYNKNSGNSIVVYLWTVDIHAFPKFKVEDAT